MRISFEAVAVTVAGEAEDEDEDAEEVVADSAIYWWRR